MDVSNRRPGLPEPSGTRQSVIAALGGGLLHGVGFSLVLHPLLGLLAPMLSVCGLAAAFWALRGASVRRSALLGAASWAAAAAAGMWWMAVVTVPGCLLLCGYWAALGAAFGALAALVRRGAGARLWPAAVAALWTAMELARTHLFTGFPWLLTGSLFAGLPVLTAPARLGGVWTASFLAALLAALAVNRRPAGLPARLGLLALLAAAWGGGGWALLRASAEPAALRLRVACVQPLVPFKVGPKADRAAQLREQGELSNLVEPGSVDLLIWSETMVPGELLEEAGTLLAPLAREKRCWLLAGGVVHETGAAGQPTGRNFNSAVLVSPEGRLSARYDKRHLVPFGEYVPLGGRFPGARAVFDLIGTVFSPGPPAQELPEAAGIRLGVNICFEDTFPEIARDDARRGARLLVNLTNDSWFGRSPEARQHLALAVLRAVETGLPLVRATNTGISALVEPSGRLTVPPGGGLWEKGLVRMSVPVSGPDRAPAPAAIIGDAFALSAAILSALAAAAGLLNLRRRPGSQVPDGPAAAAGDDGTALRQRPPEETIPPPGGADPAASDRKHRAG